MEVTKLLKKDHARVKRLLKEYEEIGEKSYDKKQEYFDILYAEIDTHSKVEEELLYPRANQIRSTEMQDLVKESYEEHAVVKNLLEELKGMSPQDEQFDAKLKVMGENVTHHADEEESEFFPLFIEKVSLQERDALGLKLEERKDTLSKGWTGIVADWFRPLIPQEE